jgi:cytochrome P450
MGAAPEVNRGFWTRAFDRLTGGVVATPFSPRLYWALVHRLFFGRYVDGVIERRMNVPGNDVVSHLLAGSGTDKLTMEELRVELIHFFLAGAPLASALAYHLLFLAQHPNVMEKARDEVLQFASSGDITLEQCKDLRYVLQTCKESRRAARLVPNTFFARITRPFEYNTFHIPAGWRAMGLIAATQHDASVFPRPEEYDPSRFESDEGAAPHPKGCPMYVAHGGEKDPHRCIGERFTDIVMVALTARLLQSYTWSLIPNQDLSPRFGKVAPVPAGGLQVIFNRSRRRA